MRRHVTAPMALSLALSLVLAAACGDDPDDPSSGDGGPGTGANASTATVAAGLAALPPSGDEQVVLWGDIARAAEIAGLERPDSGDADAVGDYVMALTDWQVEPTSGGTRVAVVPPDAAGVQRLAQAEEFVAEVGWGIAEVDTFVERQTPPETVTVMNGAFDDDALDAALGERDDGTWVLGDPEGAIDPADASAARPVGETLFLARSGDDGLVVSRQSDATGAVLDALAGEADGPTLADDAPLAAAAAALDDAGAYGALLVTPGISGTGRALSPEASLQMSDACLPAAMTATATGITDDDGVPVMLAVLVHDSADAAATNAEALERLATDGSNASGRPWSEMVTVDGIDVAGADDEVVVGRLRIPEGMPAIVWANVVTRRDGLVSSC